MNELTGIEDWFRERFLREFPEISIKSHYGCEGDLFIDLLINSRYSTMRFDIKTKSVDGHLIEDIEVEDEEGRPINRLEDFYLSIAKSLFLLI